MVSIPKDIYICWKNLEQLKEYSQIWKELNPEYTLHLYDDEMCIDFLKTEYSQKHADIFNFARDGPIKADFWRICILYRYGGLYVDADIEPLIPLCKYIDESAEFVTCYSVTDNEYLNPHFIIAAAGDEILKNCIEIYIRYYDEKRPYEYWDWSLVYIMKNQIYNNTSGVKNKSYVHNNKKFQFLQERTILQTMFNEFTYWCDYNGQVVLNCRYVIYNKNIHDFKSIHISATPKIIHQIVPFNAGSYLEESQQSWKNAFPKWEFRVWTNSDVSKLIRFKYPLFHRKYKEFINTSSDINKEYIHKWFLLYEYGGMYIDSSINTTCLCNFESKIQTGKIYDYNNTIFISPDRHIYWECLYNYLISETPKISTSLLRENLLADSIVNISNTAKRLSKFFDKIDLDKDIIIHNT
jgi:mannosyltransferase OCH1-like enzyme